MSETLIPLSREELIRDIEIQTATMRARKDVGACALPQFFAQTLVDRLLRSGLKPYRGPGVPTATGGGYFKGASE